MSDRQKIVFDFIKNWSKTHKEAILHTVILSEFKSDLNTKSLRNAIIGLIKAGYIRENTRGGNYKTYTLIRTG